MRTNIFKSAYMLFAATAFMASCSQDEVMNNEQGMEQPIPSLKVIVNTNDFTGVDVESRAVESTDGTNKHTTTFTNGDQIGIYLVDAEGKLKGEKQNIALTYNGESWDGELSYVEGTKYVAYFPYSETAVTATDKTVEEQITNTVTADQGTAANYYANDLMVTTATEPKSSGDNSYTVTFEFKHKNAMIEFVVPTTKYFYTASNGNKIEYSGGNTTLKENKVTISNTEYTAYQVSEITAEKVYRCIVKPGDVTFSFKLDDNGTEVSFDQSSNVTLAAGNYKRYNLTWNGAPTSTEATERNPKVGDYIYNDGTIYPKELAEKLGDGETIPNADKCVGIVFSNSTSSTDQTNGWKNGYVIALNNVEKETKKDGVVTIGYEYKWYDSAKATSNEDLKLETSAAANDLDGFNYWSMKKDESNYDAFYNISNYKVELPTFTSGWYLPSVGQLVAFAKNFAQDSETTTPDSFAGESKCPKTHAYLTTLFKKAGGVFYANVKTTNIADCWWSTNWGENAKGEDNAYGLSIESDTKEEPKIGVIFRGFKQTGACIRPVFAF